MILELVKCDGPDCIVSDYMESGMVPHSWISHEGHHYCRPECVIAHWGRA